MAHTERHARPGAWLIDTTRDGILSGRGEAKRRREHKRQTTRAARRDNLTDRERRAYAIALDY